MIDKEQMLDTGGRPMTQSLFLELGYTEFSVYTLKDEDYEYKGKLYPSIKKRFLEMEDVTEYEFATTYFLGWKHWMRICENKQIRVHIDEWRDELEMKIRARSVKQIMRKAEGGNFQSQKWLADRGYATRAAGRPSKAELEAHKKIAATVNEEYAEDHARIFKFQQKQ